MKHTKLRIGVLVAAAVLLLSTIAVAAADARFGLFDFLRGADQNPVLLPEASQLVQAEVPQTGGQVEDSSFALSMREAIYDGEYVHIVAAAKPASEQTLLIGPDCMLEDNASNLGLETGGTIAEYAASAGKTNIQRLSLYDDTGSISSSLDYKLEGDGTLVFIISSATEGSPDTLPLNLVCVSYPVNPNGSIDESARKETSLAFTLTRSDLGRDVRTFATPTAFASAGVTVESVELKSSPMGIYYTISCSVTDQEAYLAADDGVCFRFLDADGKIIDMAPGTFGESSPAVDGRFAEKGTLVPAESLPDSITLQCFNCWTKELYETLTIEK